MNVFKSTLFWFTVLTSLVFTTTAFSLDEALINTSCDDDSIVVVVADGSAAVYNKIQQAVNAAGPGAKILFGNGEWPKINIDNKSDIRLSGCSEASPHVHAVKISGSSGIQIDHFVFDVDAPGNVDRINVMQSSDVIIWANDIYYSKDNGIRIGTDLTGILIYDNDIRFNENNGVLLRHNVSAQLIDNIISDNGTNPKNKTGRYGLLAQKKLDQPISIIELQNNIIENNNGKIIEGSASRDIKNYNLIVECGTESSDIDYSSCQGLTISNPLDGTVVSGPLTLSVVTESIPPNAYVKYLLNGRDLSGPINVPPYSFSWHSAWYWDGKAILQALALDEHGDLLVVSDPVTFEIDNNPIGAEIISPEPYANIDMTLNWSVTPVTFDPGHSYFVDGYIHPRKPDTFPPTPAPLDTTRLKNGIHQLTVQANMNWQHYGLEQIPIYIDNGLILMDIRPVYSQLVLAPGESHTISLINVFTNGDEEPSTVPATFTIEHAQICDLSALDDIGLDQPNCAQYSGQAFASINAQGVVTGLADGVSYVTVEAGEFSHRIRVEVNTLSGLPHFTKNGQLVESYGPDSMFLRNMFHLTSDEIINTPGLGEQVKLAGINTITNSFFRNPIFSSDLDDYKQDYDSFYDRMMAPAIEHDLYVLFFGDDAARFAPNLAYILDPTTFGADALRYALQKISQGGRGIAVEMVDEVSALWGEKPVTVQPRVVPWSDGNTYTIATDGFLTFMDIVNSVPGRIPVTWPILGIHPPEYGGYWMGDPRMSDYATFGYDRAILGNVYPYGISYNVLRQIQVSRYEDHYPFVQTNKPQMMHSPATGPFYVRNAGSGNQYTPGIDTIKVPGMRPESVAVSIMYAVALGQAGVRTYMYDHQLNKTSRAMGLGVRQTGLDPFKVGTDRWHAMAASFNLIQDLEPFILQKKVSALNLGPAILTSARDGEAGRLFMAVNASEIPQKIKVDLDRYSYAQNSEIIRHRLLGATLQADAIGHSGPDYLTLAPSETAIWVIRPAADDTDITPPAISFVHPLANALVAGTISVAVNVADDNMDRVEFRLNGRLIVTDNTPPYEVTFDTTTIPKEIWHGLSAIAYDQSGNASQARIAILPQCGNPSCDTVCPQGQHQRGNECVSDLRVDSCGPTGIACQASVPNSYPTCDGVSCDFECDVPYTKDGSICQPPPLPPIAISVGTFPGKWQIPDVSPFAPGDRLVEVPTRDASVDLNDRQVQLWIGVQDLVWLTIDDFGAVSSSNPAAVIGGQATASFQTSPIFIDASAVSVWNIQFVTTTQSISQMTIELVKNLNYLVWVGNTVGTTTHFANFVLTIDENGQIASVSDPGLASFSGNTINLKPPPIP